VSVTTRSHDRSRVRATIVTGCSRRTVPTTLPREDFTYKNPVIPADVVQQHQQRSGADQVSDDEAAR
jgi:hypothetical protein